MKFKDMIYGDSSPYYGTKYMPYDSQGWLGDPISLNNAIETLRPTTVIDVGSWKGASSRFIANKCIQLGISNFEVIAIDTFLGSDEHYTTEVNSNLPIIDGSVALYDVFRSNMIQDKLIDYVTPFRIDSVNGFNILKKKGIVADLIYIDAAHDYVSVKTDIQQFRQILREGGVMICDDYSWFEGVRQAVHECIPNGNVIADKYYWINV